MFRVILFKQWRLTGGRLRLPGLSIQGGYCAGRRQFRNVGVISFSGV